MLVVGLVIYSRVTKPKYLAQEAEKACSYMKYGEVLLQIAGVQDELKKYGVISDKRQAFLTALESRKRMLKSGATQESIEREMYEYLLIANPGREIDIANAYNSTSDSRGSTEHNNEAKRLSELLSGFLVDQDNQLRDSAGLRLICEKERMIYFYFVAGAIDWMATLFSDGKAGFCWQNQAKSAVALEVFGEDRVKRRLESYERLGDKEYLFAVDKGVLAARAYVNGASLTQGVVDASNDQSSELLRIILSQR